MRSDHLPLYFSTYSTSSPHLSPSPSPALVVAIARRLSTRDTRLDPSCISPRSHHLSRHPGRTRTLHFPLPYPPAYPLPHSHRLSSAHETNHTTVAFTSIATCPTAAPSHSAFGITTHNCWPVQALEHKLISTVSLGFRAMSSQHACACVLSRARPDSASGCAKAADAWCIDCVGAHWSVGVGAL